MLGDIPYCDLLPELRAQDVNALANKILGDLGITTRNVAGVPKLPDGLMVDPPPLVHPRIRSNPLFTGREDLLEKLDVLLLDGPGKPAALLNVGGPSLGSNSMAAAKALGGLGGVGKTELAREFGWRNQSAYAGVWWIEAESDGLLNGLVDLGARFNPRIGEEKNREKAARASVEELENRGLQKPWLLIYDNAQDPAAIDGWMPRAGAHCLITSRWRDWTGEADALDVDVFPPDVAVDYLCDTAGRSQPQDREQAALLAKELGYLPLALSHAAAFCRARKATNFKEYLEKLAERVKQDPDQRTREGKDYPRSVYNTFVLALERVVAGQPELGVPPQPRAEELMGIMACLGSDGIPLDIFPESLFSRDELTGILAALDEAALVTQVRLKDDAPAVNVHRLVQRVMQVRLAAKASAAASAAAAVTLTGC